VEEENEPEEGRMGEGLSPLDAPRPLSANTDSKPAGKREE